MQDVLPTLLAWLEENRDIALAIVIRTWGSSPRQAGAWMVVSETGDFVGSVSGGCVEGAVIETARTGIKSLKSEYLHFGVADETAWEVGLACGGEIDVFVTPITQSKTGQIENYLKLREALNESERFQIAHIVRGSDQELGQFLFASESGERFGTIDEPYRTLIMKAIGDLRPWPSVRLTEIQSPEGSIEVFIEDIVPPPKLIIVGGVHIGIPLAQQAKTLGYRVYVVDPRSAFGKEARFPGIDDVISAWPREGLDAVGLDGSTAVAVLTHDPKIDDPALQAALASPAFYVGALGSRITQEKRRKRLIAAGVDEKQLARLHAPIGLNIGARAPAEIAVSIMAEIVAARAGQRSAAPSS